jgi:8-oxo-dGTP pyrophosphatase MutT (NUDIX family)
MTESDPSEVPVPIREAATVVLLRDTAEGPEVFLQRRVTSMVFAAGMTVFPGGARDADDADLLATAVRETEEETGVVISRDDLTAWSRWITPPGEIRRYDTLFFVAALPPGQEPQAQGGEMDSTVWLRPAEALARVSHHELLMLPPTFVTLRELAVHGCVADVLTAAALRRVEPIEPRLFMDDEGIGVELPDGEVLRP